jgi:hypothetical protein
VKHQRVVRRTTFAVKCLFQMILMNGRLSVASLSLCCISLQSQNDL